MTTKLPDRTGSTDRFIRIDGQNVGPAMIEMIEAVLTRHDGRARSRNAIRTSLTGNKSRGRVYAAINRCLELGLLAEQETDVLYPAIIVTPAGAQAVIEWRTTPG